MSVGGENITNKRYADDTGLMAVSSEELQRIVDLLKEESQERGLTMKTKKTQNKSITINNNTLEQVQEFVFLVHMVKEDDRFDAEIKIRIGIVRKRICSHEQSNNGD